MSQFSESDKNFDHKNLDEGQLRTLRASEAAAKEDFVPDNELSRAMGLKEIKAKYKVEIMFGEKRTVAGPNVCVIQVFESGKRFHGGGDELMYWCKDSREGGDAGCWGPIIGDWIHGGIAHCPSCGSMVRADLLTCQRFMNVPTKTLAEHVANIWRALGHNADIYCKYNPDDFRYKIMEEKVGSVKARRLRGMFIYPLKNILKDTSNGASVEGRFEAFFKA